MRLFLLPRIRRDDRTGLMRDVRLAANAVRQPAHSFKMLDVVTVAHEPGRFRITAERTDVTGAIELRCQRVGDPLEHIYAKPRDIRHAGGLKLIDGGRA